MAVNIWEVPSVGDTITTEQEVQTATSGQTVFDLVDFTYVLNGNLQVFVNGVKQIKGIAAAYEETNTSRITFISGLVTGDEVQFTNFS